MATPFNGTIVFAIGDAEKGPTEGYDVYCSDAAGATRFSPSGTAGTASPDFVNVKYGCWITELSFAAAATVKSLTINFDDKPKQTLRFSNLLETVATRVKPRIWVPAGTKLSLTQNT